MPLKGVTEQFRGRFLKRQSTNLSKTSLDQPPPKPPPKSQGHPSQPDDKHRSDAKKKEQTSKDKAAAAAQLGTNSDALLRGIGDYEFLTSLGTGKFSRVVLAKHVVSCQPYAIKVCIYIAFLCFLLPVFSWISPALICFFPIDHR
jgi:hypothetical protein